MHGSHVFWVDSDTEMMYRTDKNGKEKAVEVHGKFRNLADVQAVNRARRNGKASLKAISYEICLGLIPRLCGPKVHPLPAFALLFLRGYKPLNNVFSFCILPYVLQYKQRGKFLL